MIRKINFIQDWLKIRNSDLFKNKTIGFVPTMGFLHKGHLSLFKMSLKDNDITVASIFVNPTQFDNIEDLINYPQNIESDLKALDDLGVDFALVPYKEEIYEDEYRFKVSENEFSYELCGKHRPGHFDGVLTIINKLFNIVRPTRAYFGEKDYQQLKLIKDMVKAFYIPVQICSAPIVREESGLAMSSRNSRLSTKDKVFASKFYEFLKIAKRAEEAKENLNNNGFKVDYVEDIGDRRLGAVHFGGVRLIDNVKI